MSWKEFVLARDVSAFSWRRCACVISICDICNTIQMCVEQKIGSAQAKAEVGDCGAPKFPFACLLQTLIHTHTQLINIAKH